jgi:hypothetical protein
MTKEEQIEVKKLKPIEVGDYVQVKTTFAKEVKKEVGKGKNKTWLIENIESEFKTQGTVQEIRDDKFVISTSSIRVPLELKGLVDTSYDRSNQRIIVDKSIVFHTFMDCGVNPFGKEKRRITFYNSDIQSLLWKMGYDRDGIRKESERDWQKINFDPYVVDSDGNKQHYQRGLVWTLEQKQLLIDSIYNDIEIGKFLLRYNAWSRMEKDELEIGTMYSFDCVDGKQRLNTILEFVQDKFPDSNGNLWSDLSGYAHRRFLNYGNLSLGELPESATDEDVIDNFLTLNFTGVPMSKEHLEYVKTIKMK